MMNQEERLIELQRLAKIGESLEKAFDNGYTVVLGGYGPGDKEFCFSEQLVKHFEVVK